MLMAIRQRLYFEIKSRNGYVFLNLEWIWVRVGFGALNAFWSAYKNQNWL